MNTPLKVEERLNKKFNIILLKPETKSRFQEMGSAILGGSFDEFITFTKSEHIRYYEKIACKPAAASAKKN